MISYFHLFIVPKYYFQQVAEPPSSALSGYQLKIYSLLVSVFSVPSQFYNNPQYTLSSSIQPSLAANCVEAAVWAFLGTRRHIRVGRRAGIHMDEDELHFVVCSFIPYVVVSQQAIKSRSRLLHPDDGVNLLYSPVSHADKSGPVREACHAVLSDGDKQLLTVMHHLYLIDGNTSFRLLQS
jgi:hypothetical protein